MKTEQKSNNSGWMIKVYPFGILVLGVALNLAFGVQPVFASIPSKELLGALSLASVLLVINHSWIMTATELARFRYGIFASPEEWKTSGKTRSDITEEGSFEIERHLNTHRNTTENTVYFVFFAFIFSLFSPGQVAAWTWILMFPVARLGYTYSYFTGNDNVRGVFMSLSLLSMYGIASYFALSFIFM